MQRTLRLSLALSALTLLACGGDTTDAEPEAEATTTGDEAVEAAPIAWADMNHEQRAAFMHDTVVPEMRALFQEHDPERFADFGCRTCHGENAREVGFQMPNGVAPLNPASMGALFGSEDPMPQLMVQRVWPRMAELLGEAPFDPETQQGFSCFDCHARDEG